MVSVDGKYQIYKTALCIFVLALTISEMLTFQMFDPENVGRHHGAHLLQWCHSMINIICVLALTISEIPMF